MTHRSRTGGPVKPRSKQNKSKDAPRKLHHPPAPTTSSPQAPLPNPILKRYRDIPTDSQILDLIKDSLRDTMASPVFLNDVQKIKTLLFERKWLEVFQDPALLEVYAGRWVPSRACCFRALIASCEEVMHVLFDLSQATEGDSDEETEEEEEEEDQGRGESSTSTQHILSLGGGAGSELLALASLIAGSRSSEISSEGKGKSRAYTYTALDIGAWSSVLDKFTAGLQRSQIYQLPQTVLQTHYAQLNLLEDIPTFVATLQTRPPKLVTLLFTLCELLQQSRQSTITVLHNLTRYTSPGTYFLIADSASDISEFEIGTSGRKWPVYMLLDTILSGMGGWERVEGEDSRWFRFEEGVGVGWPVKLENTRYWYRVYKRI